MSESEPPRGKRGSNYVCPVCSGRGGLWEQELKAYEASRRAPSPVVAEVARDLRKEADHIDSLKTEYIGEYLRVLASRLERGE